LPHIAEYFPKNVFMMTAMHLAAAEGHVKTVDAFLSKGAKVDAREGRGKTALHLAARSGHLALAQFLIKEGAPMEAADFQVLQTHVLVSTSKKSNYRKEPNLVSFDTL
jgi:ankyrin repeat protein